MRRITIDETRAACEATGYQLLRGLVINDKDRCGCPIGLVARAGGYNGSYAGAGDTLGLDGYYQVGFMKGFDGRAILGGWFGCRESQVGHADGVAIRQALFPSS